MASVIRPMIFEKQYITQSLTTNITITSKVIIDK